MQEAQSLLYHLLRECIYVPHIHTFCLSWHWYHHDKQDMLITFLLFLLLGLLPTPIIRVCWSLQWLHQHFVFRVNFGICFCCHDCHQCDFVLENANSMWPFRMNSKMLFEGRRKATAPKKQRMCMKKKKEGQVHHVVCKSAAAAAGGRYYCSCVLS